MRRILRTKIERLTYLIICLWLFLGFIAILRSVAFDQLAVYFLSLSGFAAAYVFGETKRPSEASPLFMKGPSSDREKMMYYIVAIWLFLGVVGMVKDMNLTQMGSYFASLTPFVSAYIIGQTFKPEVPILTSETSGSWNDGEGYGVHEADDNETDDSAPKPPDNFLEEEQDIPQLTDEPPIEVPKKTKKKKTKDE